MQSSLHCSEKSYLRFPISLFHEWAFSKPLVPAWSATISLRSTDTHEVKISTHNQSEFSESLREWS